MKGLSKGFRYISQFFENEKEPEIQIGNPTDVKHVAHIGNDGPFNNAPSWMNEFNNSSELLSTAKDNTTTKSSNKDSLPRDITEVQKSTGAPSDGTPARHNSSKTKQSKRNPNDSSARESSEGTKHRRHKNSNSDSSLKDSSDRPRRSKNLNAGSDSTAQDSQHGVPRHPNRKKSRSGDSTRSSRSKESTESLTENFGNMDLGSGFESKGNEMQPNPGLEQHEKVKLCDEVSCEYRGL
ncbi:hypothetical protein LguiA_001385 [Lonicera macranthoides]